MSTETTPARPYRVHVDVLTFTGPRYRPQIRNVRWVNRSLPADDTVLLGGGADPVQVLTPFTFGSLAWLGVLALLAVVAAFIPVLGPVAAAAGWTFGLGIFALRHGRRLRAVDRMRRRVERAHTAAVAASRIKRIDLQDPAWLKLRRIEIALGTLQARHGHAFDEQARAAVAAVLDSRTAEPAVTPALGRSEDSRRRARWHQVLDGLHRPPDPLRLITDLEREAQR